jgi:trk system potassium uptake protein TrkA
MYIIVGGGGDIGYYVTKSLFAQGHEVLLIEKGLTRYLSLKDELGQSVFHGDACEARTMDEVGANRADVVLAVTGEDEDNMVICQVAKKRYKVARTMARLNNPKHEAIFQRAGIDIVVSPTKTILSLIESELPSSRFVPLMTLKSAGLEIIEVRIPAESSVTGKSLGAVNLPRSCNLALIIRDKQFITPNSETILLANDDVFALVNREGEEALRSTFGTAD